MEALNLWLIGALIVSNAAQFLFWSRQCHKLLDRIMSRNYADYVQAKVYEKTGPKTLSQEIAEEGVQSNDAVLQELNNMLIG